MSISGRLLVAFGALLALEGTAWAQACCVGASGLTPGWVNNHERALVGAQLRVSETIGTYPTVGPYYKATPDKDTRVEPSLFGTVRLSPFLPRAQVSAVLPFEVVRRRSHGIVERRNAFGDAALVGRYDIVRTGESSWLPGIGLLLGTQIPTGTPAEKGTPTLDADVTGLGEWELNGGVMVEKTFGHFVTSATVVAGYRFPRTVLGVEHEHLGWRGLYVLGGGWVFDNEVALLGTLSHWSEGDTSIGLAGQPRKDSDGTGFRSTTASFLVVVPITDNLRMRTAMFSDLPPLGTNRPALAGTSISIMKTWY